MVVSKRKHIIVPITYFSNLISNITDLDLDTSSIIYEETVENERNMQN